MFLLSVRHLNAQVVVVEPVPDLMNNVEGELIICPPDEGLVERTLKLVDDFFANYNFNDDLKEFVQEFVNDFEAYQDLDCNPELFNGSELKDMGCVERSFDEIFTDPRFDTFAKIVKLYPDYQGKGIFSNLNDIAQNLGASEKIPKCNFNNKKFVSGGLKIAVEGKKADSGSTSGYFLTQKNADKSSFTIPYYINSDDYGKNSSSHYDFFKKNSLADLRVLQKPLLSIVLAYSAPNDFLNYKITEGQSKTTRLSGRHAGIYLKFNTSMYCSETLYLTGFCNIDSLKYSALRYGYGIHSYQISGKDEIIYDDIDYNDKKYINNYGLNFALNKLTLTKSNINGESKASLSANGILREKGYEGARIFLNLNFTKGEDLPGSHNIIDFQKKGMYSEGTLVDVTEAERIPYLDIVVPIDTFIKNGYSAKSFGQSPILDWSVNFTDYYANSGYNKGYNPEYLKYSIQNFDIYRNKEKLARVDASTFSYVDRSLTEADKGKIFEYSVIANNYFNTIKSSDGTLTLKGYPVQPTYPTIRFGGTALPDLSKRLQPVFREALIPYFRPALAGSNYYLVLDFTLNDKASNQPTSYVPEKIIVLFNGKVYKEYDTSQLKQDYYDYPGDAIETSLPPFNIDKDAFKKQFGSDTSLNISVKAVVESQEVLESDPVPIIVPF